MAYELLEHTADVKFRAEGDTLEDAFIEAVHAFSDIVRQGSEIEGEYVVGVEVESESLDALLFDFIDRLIYLQDSRGVVVVGVEDLDIRGNGGYSLSAHLDVAEIRRGMGLLDIKGPTYNEMLVEEDGGWLVEAVMDI